MLVDKAYPSWSAEKLRTQMMRGLFQLKTEMSTHHGLLLACSVSPVHNGKVVVQLVNLSSVPATLHRVVQRCLQSAG